MNKNTFKAGIYKQQYDYKSFSPTPVNVLFKWNDPQVDVLLEDATRYLGELNAYSRLVPDVDFFIQMHIYKEATTSRFVLKAPKQRWTKPFFPKKRLIQKRRDDWAEVQNYTKAMNYAVAELESLPL